MHAGQAFIVCLMGQVRARRERMRALLGAEDEAYQAAVKKRRKVEEQARAGRFDLEYGEGDYRRRVFDSSARARGGA